MSREGITMPATNDAEKEKGDKYKKNMSRKKDAIKPNQTNQTNTIFS